MIISWTVNIGQIVTAIVFLFTIAGFYYGTNFKLGELKKDVDGITAKLETVQTLITSMALATQRLDRIEEDIRDLKHGKGFVRNEV
jgi:p-aminobenzoyl-glutamate transporter AbgT